MRRSFTIAVTGVPATGKTTFSKRLKKALQETGRKVFIVELNDLVDQYHLYGSVDKLGTRIVDVKRLSSSVRKTLSGRGSGAEVSIIVGHLAPELDVKYDLALVTRARLTTLLQRMKARRYPKEKIRDNIVSETFDYCGARIKKRTNVIEIESEKDKAAAISYIKKTLGRPGQAKGGKIGTRMPELLMLIEKNKRLGF